jgi:hypothetical protein
MGRPTKLTEQTKQILLDSIAAGMPYKLACLRAGISEDTLVAWRKKGAEGREPYASFVRELQTAEGDAVFMRLQHIEGAAMNGQWQASAWLLERRYPQFFGRQDRLQAEVSGPDGGPMEFARVGESDVVEEIAAAVARLRQRKGASDDTEGSEPGGEEELAGE